MSSEKKIVLSNPQKFLLARFRCGECGNRFNMNPDRLTVTCGKCKNKFDIKPMFDMYSHFVPQIQELLEKQNEVPIYASDTYFNFLTELNTRYKKHNCYIVTDIKRVKATMQKKYCNECGFCEDCMTCKICKKSFKPAYKCPYCSSEYITNTYNKNQNKCTVCGSVHIRPTVFKGIDKCSICTSTNIKKFIINSNMFKIRRLKRHYLEASK